MVDPATVRGTPKSATMPPIEMGSADTLKDMRICPRNRPTIGSHDRRSARPLVVVAVVVMTRSFRSVRAGFGSVRA